MRETKLKGEGTKERFALMAVRFVDKKQTNCVPEQLTHILGASGQNAIDFVQKNDAWRVLPRLKNHKR